MVMRCRVRTEIYRNGTNTVSIQAMSISVRTRHFHNIIIVCWASVACTGQYPISPSQYFMLAVLACWRYWHDALNQAVLIVTMIRTSYSSPVLLTFCFKQASSKWQHSNSHGNISTIQKWNINSYLFG